MTDYSQMTNEQINERLAVGVMGWQKWLPEDSDVSLWLDKDEMVVSDNIEWQPADSEHLHQTVMCAEKFGREIYIEKRVGGDYWVMIGELSDNPSVAENALLPRALSEAILQAVDNG